MKSLGKWNEQEAVATRTKMEKTFERFCSSSIKWEKLLGEVYIVVRVLF